MRDFIELMKETSNVEVTENGALGYKTTHHSLLDLHFALSSLRLMDAIDIIKMWVPAYLDDKALALRWLFYIRDIRGGMGERRTFRIILKWLANTYPSDIANIIVWRSSFTLNNGPLVPYFGRWDDLTVLFGTPLEQYAVNIFITQLRQDIISMQNHKSISLCAKWTPSINAGMSSKKKAEILRKAMHMSPKAYKHMLSGLRKYADILEVKTSANRWNEINYEGVPSCANITYANAFLRHDEERRRQYLNDVTAGKKKINAAVSFPYQIYHALWEARHRETVHQMNEMWNALPDTINGNDLNTLVVCDSSDSMKSAIGNSEVMAIEVSESMAIYFAERMSGPFANKFITFSSHPEIVEISPNLSLYDKAHLVRSKSDFSNTDLHQTFMLVLQTAVINHLSQEELPQNLLIISDMEFDYATTSCNNETLMKTIAREFAEQGYKLPRLVFWNVNSRTNTIPVKENDYGVALVSGFSPNVAKMVMSNKLDPWELLLEQIKDPRYQVIEDAMKGGFTKPDCDYSCGTCNSRCMGTRS